MVRAAYVVIALLAATPALAQNSETICRPRADGVVVCNTETHPSAQQRSEELRTQEYRDSLLRLEEKRLKAAQDAALIAALKTPETPVALPPLNPNTGWRAVAAKAEVDMVTETVKAGRCDEARRIALSFNNLDLADKAVRTCVPAK